MAELKALGLLPGSGDRGVAYLSAASAAVLTRFSVFALSKVLHLRHSWRLPPQHLL